MSRGGNYYFLTVGMLELVSEINRHVNLKIEK